MLENFAYDGLDEEGDAVLVNRGAPLRISPALQQALFDTPATAALW